MHFESNMERVWYVLDFKPARLLFYSLFASKYELGVGYICSSRKFDNHFKSKLRAYVS